MATFLDILNGGEAATTVVTNQTPQVEPLGGPSRVADIMDRFPEELYQQGPDTHLWRFMEALCGDAGAGLLKKQTYLARLTDEAEILQYTDLDTFYVHHFSFKRLRNEIYELDTETQTMSADEWDDVNNKDESYRHRVQTFFNATRLGCTVDGMAMASEAGSGVPAEVRENYRYIFDRYSDDPLGLTPVGRTESVNEFIVMPRLVRDDGTLIPDVSYETPYDFGVRVDVPSFAGSIQTPDSFTAARPVPIPSARRTTGLTQTETPAQFLNPDIHRNMLDILDRLRPVTTVVTVTGQQFRTGAIEVGASAASSERIILSRFVNGNPEVQWPDVNRELGMFIESGVENEATYYANQQAELLVIFHTIEGISTYQDAAVLDDYYNTPGFYLSPSANPASDGTGTIAPVDLHASTHIGEFSPQVVQVFPFLSAPGQSPDFNPYNATPAQNTTLLVNGKWS